MVNLPNTLTLSRILVIPVVVFLFYFDNPMNRWIMLTIYIIAGITDFFDGYLARKSNQVSSLGRFLDPIADKLLVACLLIMLAGFNRISDISLLPAMIILAREILVSGLREFLAELKVIVHVTFLAKWKTGLQMVSLGFLIVGSDAPNWLFAETVGELLLWLAGILTLITGFDYIKLSIKHINEKI
tara:strand:+ start:333 stop:890 length:558 start_codon:yes stop_codon:yes gene_type:complete